MSAASPTAVASVASRSGDMGPPPRGATALPMRRALTAALVLGLTLVVGVPAEVGASEVITHGSRARPWVALTFDDGWSADRCARIVRTLRAKRATATFLINGSIVRGAPKRWRSMLKGFPVANHTLTHPFLDRLSWSSIRREILVNQRVIERALGRPMLRLLRPPYGAYDGTVVRVADSLGYRTILWDTSGGDTTSGATTSSVIRHASRGRSGAIVLLHCGPSVTPAAVGPIIDSYRRRGYRLVDLAQMLDPQVSPTACRVRNRDTGVTKGSLGAAVRAASPGHRLTVRGTCRGSTIIGKSLRIRGIRVEDSGVPSLVGRKDGRVVTVPSDVNVTLRDLTIRNGRARYGGGIANRGTLALVDVTVRDNRATVSGGGMSNRGALDLRATTSVRSNAAPDGAGIVNRGTLTMRRSSSVRRNTASGLGGGVLNRGLLRMLEASDIAGNEAASGGGIFSEGELEGVRCAPADDANVHGNTPDDCQPPPVAPTARRASRR